MYRFSTILILSGVLLATSALCLPQSAAAASRQSPDSILQAKQMLSPYRWAEAIRIENTNRNSRYPRRVYATVFELNDSLWFYTVTGTQELRRSRGQTAEFKNDLMPLLRSLERGFVSYDRLPQGESEMLDSFPQLVNGCVIESVYTVESMAAQGESLVRAHILLYASTKNTRRGRNGNATGHAVLVYETPEGVFFIDPPDLSVVGTLSPRDEWDPVAMALEIEEPYGKIEIEEAFFVPFPVQRATLAGTGM